MATPVMGMMDKALRKVLRFMLDGWEAGAILRVSTFNPLKKIRLKGVTF
jgi:hypothetical protein